MTRRKRIIQPVTFSEGEEYLLEYAKGQGKPFATFIKDLIRKDKGEETEQLTKQDAIKLFHELLREQNLSFKKEVPMDTAVHNPEATRIVKNQDKPDVVEHKHEQHQSTEAPELGSKAKSAYKFLINK